MSTKIFISYRRDDSQAQSELVYQALEQRFGSDAIFMDSNNIDGGSKWPDRIRQALSDTQLVLAVIISPGKWMGVNAETGEIRIKDDSDWVYRELSTTFASRKSIMPVLSKAGDLPKSSVLPDSIKSLPDIQSLKLDFDRWDDVKEDLVNQCEQLLETAGVPTPRSWSPAELDKQFGSFASLAAQIFHVQSVYSFLEAIDKDKPVLRQFVSTVRSVRETKELHDIAHDTQVDTLSEFKRRTMDSIPGNLKNSFMSQYRGIQNAQANLTKLRDEGEFQKNETGWVQQFLSALAEMEWVIRSNDRSHFPETIEALDRLLKQQQVDLNKRLVCLVYGDLCLSDVAFALSRALQEQCDKTTLEREQEIDLDCEKLHLFEQQFRALLDIHNKWQNIDSDLSGLEIELSHRGDKFDIEHVLTMFSDVQQKLNPVLNVNGGVDFEAMDGLMFVRSTKEGLGTLSDQLMAVKMGKLLAGREIEDTFIFLKDSAQQIFRAIDKYLRERCKDLVKLEALVRELLCLYSENGGESNV
jgi:hypothetical protein